MAHDVFLSHSSADGRAVEQVCAALEAAGIRCWISSRDALPGRKYQGSIIRAIRQCRVLVLLLTRRASASEHVFRELHAAFEDGRVIVPLRLDDVEPGDDLSYYLAPLHWLNAQEPPLEQHLERLIDVIRPHLAGAPRGDETEALPGGAAEAGPSPPALRTSLPSETTPFIGRSAELRELMDMMLEPDTRLVTVTGPGGAGKTRLALKAAAAVAAEFAHGVGFVSLTGPASADVLVQAIAQGLGVSLSRTIEPMDELTQFLREKQMLLVIDNFDDLTEHAAVLSALLEGARGVRMLVTSRERLHLLQETLHPLGGLAHDSGDAAQLFITTARRHDRGFALDADTRARVDHICRLLDRMPLAIELAAAWVRVLSCDDIAAELERGIDLLSTRAGVVPERHRSMRAVFDASWRLLAPDEQRAIARLSIMRAPFDRQAAAAVADADVAVLRALLDKSLLTRAGGRFRMLDLVRQYALERLRAEPGAEHATRGRHLNYFADLLRELEAAAVRWHPQAFTHISESIDDVRQAWSFAVETIDADAMLRALRALFHFYVGSGWAREGTQAFGHAADALQQHGPADRRDVALAGALLDVCRGALHDRLGQPEPAEPLLAHGLAQARTLGDPGILVFALHRLGSLYLDRGRRDEAERLQREALAISEADGNEYGAAWSRTHLGNIAMDRGAYDEAAALYDEALASMRASDDRAGMWAPLTNLGIIAAMRQQYDEATQRFQEGLVLQLEAGNRRLASLLLHNLGCVASDAGDYAAARLHLEEALAMSEEMGYQGMAALSLATLAEALERAGEKDEAYAQVERTLRTLSRAHNYQAAYVALLTLARLRRSDGDPQGAARLAAFVQAHPASGDDPRRQAAELIADIGIEPATPPQADVEQVIADVLDQVFGRRRGGAAAVELHAH